MIEFTLGLVVGVLVGFVFGLVGGLWLYEKTEG